MNSISLYIAFVAGLVSFLSPCVLPIIPGFLSYLAGTSLEAGNSRKKDIFLSSLFFVLGFSIVFAVLGVLLNTVLQSVAYGVQIWLSRFGGLLVILFGLYLTGLIKISYLDRPHTFSVKTGIHSKHVTAFLFGLAFAAGWTPCVGAALGAILGIATSQPGSAFVLLLAYALGLGAPFLVIGFFASQASVIIDRYSRFLKYVNVAFGILLIMLGVFIFTGNLSLLANFELLNKFLIR
jgi:cytochrome c-type biogenesis protein